MCFYWSYTLLLSPPVLMRSCSNYVEYLLSQLLSPQPVLGEEGVWHSCVTPYDCQLHYVEYPLSHPRMAPLCYSTLPQRATPW